MKFLRLLAFLSFPSAVFAQNSVIITAPLIPVDVAATHLLVHVDPLYPPIARAAHVEGTVVLQFEIRPDGHIGKVKIISGPQMLIGAAEEAVKDRKYRPFNQGGSPSSVSVQEAFSFDLGLTPKDEEIARKYFSLDNACVKAVQGNAVPSEQAKDCVGAAEMAETFPQGTRFIERRSAFVYATTALLRSGDNAQALSWGKKAVEEVQRGHDDNSGDAAAYAARAQAEIGNGDLPAADNDLNVAEDFGRKGVEWARSDQLTKDLVPSYTRMLKTLLNLHARVLSGLHRDADAKAKSDEADKL